jgi:hypothetical protein
VSTEETAVRPDQILKLIRLSSFRIGEPDEDLRKKIQKVIVTAFPPQRNVKDRCQPNELAFRLKFSEVPLPATVVYPAANRRPTFLSELFNHSSWHHYRRNV